MVKIVSWYNGAMPSSTQPGIRELGYSMGAVLDRVQVVGVYGDMGGRVRKVC